MQPPREDIARSHVVMRRHDEVRQQSLCRRFARQRRQFGHDAIRTQIVQQVELPGAGDLGPLVRQVDDFALCRPVDRAVRLVDEALQVFGMPMVAARLLLVAVHALLHDRPLPVVGHEEPVQIKVEAVLDGGAVDLRDEDGRRKGRDLIYAGKVDHGFDTASAKDLQARLKPLIRKTQPYSKKIAHRGIWVEPSLLAEIEYRAKSAEGKVRHPFFKGIREDL